MLQGKVIRFHQHGILINYQDIHDYLLSKECVFKDCSLMDFFESLQVLQFSRLTHSKKYGSTKSFYLFINPNFHSDLIEVPDDFYMTPIDITSFHLLKGTKRMTNLHHIGLFQRLLNRSYASKLKISRLEYAILRIDYEFQRRKSLLNKEEDLIKHDVQEPQYVKDNEIAGYYGNVPLEALKIGFSSYFPIYQEQNTEDEENNDENSVQEKMETNEIDAGDKIENAIEEASILTDVAMEVTVSEITQENSRKRKRKSYSKRGGKVSKQELDDAVSFLEREIAVE